jgi:hypothetical protein
VDIGELQQLPQTKGDELVGAEMAPDSILGIHGVCVDRQVSMAFEPHL